MQAWTPGVTYTGGTLCARKRRGNSYQCGTGAHTHGGVRTGEISRRKSVVEYCVRSVIEERLRDPDERSLRFPAALTAAPVELAAFAVELGRCGNRVTELQVTVVTAVVLAVDPEFDAQP